MGNPIIIEPSIKQVRSGKVSKPTKVHVTTTLMEFQADNESITIRTAWEIDYDRRELRYYAGLLELLTEFEPLFPWRVPDRHLRAARRVAATAFGMKRFRRPVRMYELFEKDHLFIASYKKERILLEHEADAIIWGIKFKDPPKVEKMPVTTAAKLFDLSTQSAIENAQRMSLIQKSRLFILMQRSSSYFSAEKDVKKIMRSKYPVSLVNEFAEFTSKLEYEIRKRTKK